MKSEEFVQILKAINNLADEVRDEKIQNKKRWQENEKRWQENAKLWQENNKSWEEYRKNRKKDKEDILNILLSFQNSVENMYKENKERIANIEKKCPNCKIKVI